jgi:acetylornithine/succinyldiaminopimelate/putrescine aminotransferase
MGNGYPVAAVIARQELFHRLKAETEVFSAFGGNPVAARAALAVLDVIEDERLIDNAARVGEELRGALEELDIGTVRGRGLLVGAELETSVLAERVDDDMRDAGVLINRTGPQGNVLKIPSSCSRASTSNFSLARAHVRASPLGQVERKARSSSCRGHTTVLPSGSPSSPPTIPRSRTLASP